MKRAWPLYSLEELQALPEPKWLVEGHFTDGMTVVYGPPASGKTFLVLSWALAVATGKDWFGHKAIHAPVLYVSGEGGGGLSRRIQAWRYRNDTPAPEMYAALGTVRLAHHEHVEALTEDVKVTGAKLLIVDTLARSMAGADENSAQDMGMVVNALDSIRRSTGCASMVVHHTGVDKSRYRGSTALQGATDTEIKVDKEERTITVTCPKQKDAKEFKPLAFDLFDTQGSCTLARSSRPVVMSGYMPGAD